MQFTINGGKKLSGEIEVRGAKNSVLKGLAASLLFKDGITVDNAPVIEDVMRMAELLEHAGARVMKSGARAFEIDVRGVKNSALSKDIAKRFRASIVLAGPMLARMGRVSFPHPGGCVIGKRPIDLFLSGWQAMGASVKESEAGFEIAGKRLHGADFTFRVVSVTGTETLMMTAALAEGKTILRNAACEPEIPHLAEFLNAAGASIQGAGTPVIEIAGTGGKLLSAASVFMTIPDRIEAGSYIILGAALGGTVKVTRCNPEHLATPLALLQDAGVAVEAGSDWVKVKGSRSLKAIDVKTREYPGFPTDLQAPFAVLMTQAAGESLIFETIWESRFGYVEDLKRMGADIIPCDPHRIIVKGPTTLHGRDIESPDLRAGLAFVIAALLAEGKSSVRNVYQIDRGYEKIDERLRMLGADIVRTE